MKNLSFRQLRIFESAARLSSFARAAAEMHLSAPAISMQMKDLEEDLGMPLFAKRGRGLVLTSAGEYFLVYARRVLIALKETEDMMLKLKGMEIGTLNIGLVSTAKYIAPHLLARFRLEHPGIKLVIHVRNRDQLIGLLREAAIDVAIMGKPPKDLDVRAEAFANNPHAFICSPDHPLAQERTVNLAQLDSEEILIREQGSGTRTVMENFFEVGRFRPLSTLEMSTTETIKQAVMAGLGISFVSLHAVGLETKHGVLRILAVEGTPVIRVWHLVSRGGRPASLAAEAFRYFVLEQGNALLQDLFGAESERQSTHF
ncbi:MAG: LysR substrate-binding domain-containing protein [Burkholderiaceae bacterium]|jgi:LysR family transcriptional regulator, low CO2-responsive transcriptional regulator|nr:LysR substrate-binding domain-containing protein [Burkholderiaceae bacterium]